MADSLPRLLIVDDDEGIRRSLARIMRCKGFEVELAADGESALVLSQAYQPDLLILDIRLPGMDGVSTFSAIREVLPSVPAVFMTAYAASDLARTAQDLGALSVLPKPLDVAAVTEIAQACRQVAPVLIVDDDLDLLASLARALRVAGIEVQTAGSFRQGIQCVRQRPDRTVIADVFLADGFGYELLYDMARHTRESSMVLITGKGDWLEQNPLVALAECSLGCLTKPVDIDELIGRIKRLQQTTQGA